MRRSFLAPLVAVLLATSSAFAQSPPPTQLVWLKADTGVFKDAGVTPAANNDTVQQWSDQSGNASNLTQSTGANRPTLKTSITNGLPVVRCDGVASFMTGPNVYPTTHSYTLVVVSIQRGTSPGNLVSGTTGHALYYNSTSFVNYHLGATSTQELTAATATGTGILAEHILGVYETSNSTSGQTEATNLLVNGNYNSGMSDNSANTDNTLQLCAYNGANFNNGDIAEVIIYNRLLSLSETNTLITYLNSRYGTSVEQFGSAQQELGYGDSITAGLVGAPPFFMLAANHQAGTFAINFGSEGAYMLDLKNGISTLTAFLITAPTLGRNIVTVFAGTNDIALGGRTAAQVYADWQNVCSTLHSTAPNTLVGVIDMLPRGAGSEAARTTLNASFDADTCADFHVKTTCNSSMWAAGANSNPTWFAPDTVHPNTSGHSIIGACLNTAIDALTAIPPYAGAPH